MDKWRKATIKINNAHKFGLLMNESLAKDYNDPTNKGNQIMEHSSDESDMNEGVEKALPKLKTHENFKMLAPMLDQLGKKFKVHLFRDCDKVTDPSD